MMLLLLALQGQVHSIQVNLGYPLKDVKRMISPELAGGALLDVGVYTDGIWQ